MTVLNPSFEIAAAAPASPGRAADWGTTTTSSLSAFAQFGVTLLSEGEAHETFEHGWPVEDQYVGSLVSGVNLELAVFQAGSLPLTFENFESGWFHEEHQVPEQRYSCLGAVEAAIFNSPERPRDFDDFSWGTTYTAFATSNLSWFDFAHGGEWSPAEAFEAHWHGNEDFLPHFGTGQLESALFLEGNQGLQEAESFEAVSPTFPIIAVDEENARIHIALGLFIDGMSICFGVRGENSELPSPFREETTYFVLDWLTPSFQVSSTLGGIAMDIASQGRGTRVVTYSTETYWVRTI